jgi:hypothetical protein
MAGPRSLILPLLTALLLPPTPLSWYQIVLVSRVYTQGFKNWDLVFDGSTANASDRVHHNATSREESLGLLGHCLRPRASPCSAASSSHTWGRVALSSQSAPSASLRAGRMVTLARSEPARTNSISIDRRMLISRMVKMRLLVGPLIKIHLPLVKRSSGRHLRQPLSHERGALGFPFIIADRLRLMHLQGSRTQSSE